MPTTCRLKHLCSIRAWIPVSFFLVILSFLLSLLQANSLEHRGPLSPLSCPGFWDPLEKAPCAFTHSRGRPVPTCSSESLKNRTLLAFHVNQGMSASFSLLLSYHRLRTTRFWSSKGPTKGHFRVCGCSRNILMDKWSELQNHFDSRTNSERKGKKKEKNKLFCIKSIHLGELIIIAEDLDVWFGS